MTSIKEINFTVLNQIGSCINKPSQEMQSMKRKSEDFFIKNSELSTEFSKYILDHPETDEFLTEEKIVIFLPEFDPELKEFNLTMAKEIEAEGEEVLYVRVKQLSPKIQSRLVGIEIEAKERS